MNKSGGKNDILIKDLKAIHLKTKSRGFRKEFSVATATGVLHIYFNSLHNIQRANYEKLFRLVISLFVQFF